MFGLRGKLVLLAGSVCIIPSLLFMVVVNYSMTNNSIAELEENVNTSVKLKTMWMESWCNEVVGGAESVASNSLLQDEQDNQTIMWYLEEVKTTSHAESVVLVAPSGISHVNTDGKQVDLSDRDYVSEALAGKTSPGGVVISEATGNSIFSAAAPIIVNGQVTGAVVITRNVQAGMDLLNEAFGYDSRDSFFINPDKRIMTEGRLADVIRLTTIDTAPAQAVSTQTEGLDRYINHRGVEVIGAWDISEYGWAMVEEVEVAELLSPIQATIRFLIIILACLVILAFATAFFVSGSISKPISKLALSANRMAEGDLSQDNKVVTKSKDEVGKLAVSFNTMLDNTRELIAKVKKTAGELGEKSNTISVSSDEVAASNTEQANIAQEVSQAITELSKATEAIASNAYAARQSGDGAFTEAKESSKAVREAIESLQSIKTAVYQLGISSKRIGEIVSVIDDIADQTNLLALNAAIEAARAGEHGKSFTVVAEAVRDLAEKAGSSTKEIASLVSDTQQQIQDAVDISETGAGKANQAVGALDSIVNQIEAIATKIGEISAAGEQQAASAEEVTASMESLSAASEEVSASSQEMAGSAKLLSRLGQELRKLVDQFTNV